MDTITILSKAVVDAANAMREVEDGDVNARLKTNLEILSTVSHLDASKLKAIAVIAVYEEDDNDLMLTNVSGSGAYIDRVANLLKYTSESMWEEANCQCPGCVLKRAVGRDPLLAEILRGMGVEAGDFVETH